MKELTSEKILELYSQHKDLESAARDAGYAYLKMKGWNIKPKSHARIVKIWFDDDDTFCVEWEGGCGCCAPDTYGEEWLPLYALWDIESFLVEAKLRGDFENGK